ncbi:glycosyltransferase family 4 protein [Sphingomonas abietis]|uniref:Glycosyltransferase family 1 protein n=1 Tax=Sphingomonas abietis TaxID=3012344 RepID=A0ABY7NTF0_9SPHN|nr:glycosyltransferase family 1 protein [Sphingomonas abietis]WBO22731.1 glycosyltransferase family 1 protein [Sphingomonas abietis]
MPEVPICIDGRMLSYGGAGTGVGQFARTVRTALQTAGIQPSILEDGGTGLHRSQVSKLLAAVRPWQRHATASAQGFFARDIFREAYVFFDIHKRPMPVALPGPAGIMHWSYPLPLRIIGWRNLYTAHDVLPLDPAIPSPVNGLRLRRLLDAIRAAGGEFATVSDAARAQIVERMGWPADSVTSCHQAVDVAGADQGDLPGGLQPGAYLLYVGAVEARKNLHRLIDAYRGSGITTPLVISGPDGLDAASIDARIAATPGAVRLGLQSRGTVLQLLANARALAFVSLAEGFGLPVAEAMALGTPVLAGDVPALAEVSAGAALLVDPLDLTALQNALIAIDGDASLRNRLSMLGTQRARHFALGPYAHRLLTLYGMA